MTDTPGTPTRAGFVALAFGTTACGVKQTFEVRGRVVGFGDDPRTVIVEFDPQTNVRTLGLNAQLAINSDDPDDPTVNVSLTGDATPVSLSEFGVE